MERKQYRLHFGSPRNTFWGLQVWDRLRRVAVLSGFMALQVVQCSGAGFGRLRSTSFYWTGWPGVYLSACVCVCVCECVLLTAQVFRLIAPVEEWDAWRE